MTDNAKGSYLLPIKYKSATWYSNSYKTKGGTLTATQKIINSSRQNIAELGVMQNEFTVEGFIAAAPVQLPAINEIDYIEVKQEVISALNSPDRGTLEHPTFGVVENVKAISWSLDESDESLGIGKLKVKFGISNAIDPDTAAVLQPLVGESDFADLLENMPEADLSDIVPGSVLVPLSFLEQLGLDVAVFALSVFDNIAAFVSLPMFQSALEVVGDIAEGFSKALDFVEFVSDKIDEVSATISDFAAQIGQLAAIPGLLVTSITNVFGVINSAVTSAITGFTAMTSFFDFGWVTGIDPFTALNSGTQQSRDEASNAQNVNTTMNCTALLGSYTHITGLEIRTVDELDNIESILDLQYQGIVDNGNLDLEIVQSVSEARDLVRSYFDNIRPNVARVVEIHSGNTSARTLAYRLYGSDSDANSIADLNLSNGIVMGGSLKVFSQ
jgi:hypothetical protein|tara:strand:+ start:667 stop:1995 length:1329 start_codon:yes stop_codon:yes gene_type:complete